MKISLLGDSIRLGAGPGVNGYGKRTRELLGPDFEVFEPMDNCRFAKYTLRGLFDWQGDMSGSRIVHWNNGLWDICDIFGDGDPFCTVDEYVSVMLRIARIFKSRYDVVIFATTTPVLDTNPYNKNSTIEQFNAALVPRLVEMGVIINDLHSLVNADRDKYLHSDTLHLSDAGVEICAKAVADVIMREAQKLL